MSIIPFIPAGTTIQYGLSKYQHGYRLRLPLPLVYHGRRYNINNDAYIVAWWNLQVVFRWRKGGQWGNSQGVIGWHFGRLAFASAYVNW